MQSFIGLDFGTANTVIQVFNETLPEPQQLFLETGSKPYGEVQVIPSQITYTTPDQFEIGLSAEICSGYAHSYNFRWMKNYQLHRNPYHLKVEDQLVSSEQAAESFLHTILAYLEKTIPDIAGIGLTVPVDAYEPYESWLSDICERHKLGTISLIDEASAAAIGADIQRLPGQIVCVIDFGAGTLDISIVKFDEAGESQHQRCTVLAKYGTALGGMHIDQWLYQYVIRQCGFDRNDARLNTNSAEILRQCELAKISLSTQDTAEINFDLHDGTPTQSIHITDIIFLQLLEQHNFLTQLRQVLDTALAGLQQKGYQASDISQVISIGGSSLLPPFQSLIRNYFPNIPVATQHALDAVSRGAALFASGQPFFNHIQHDYALRYYDAEQDTYKYRLLINKGTPYPSQGALAEFYIQSTYEGQNKFGLAIYEINQHHNPVNEPMELFFNDQGAVQLTPLTKQVQEEREHIWLNELNPTFLVTNSPAAWGENQFKVSFSLDGNKRLLVSSYDMIVQSWTLLNQPVIKLS